MRGGAVKGFHRSQQPVIGRHGWGQADVLGVQGLVLMVFQFHKWRHEAGREVKVGDVWHQAGIIVVDVWGALPAHVRRLPIKSMWRRPEVWVLRPSPGRVLADSRVWHTMPRVVMRGTDLLREIALGVVKAVGIRRPLKGVPRWEVILHEARREAVEVMRVWRLVELRVLLMRGERPPEVRGTLHAEGGLPLAPAPRGLLVLVVPRCLKLIVPGGVRLVVPGGFTLAVPSGLPLLIPHPFVVTVPGGAMGRALMMGEWGLLWGLLLPPRGNGVGLFKPGWLIWRNMLMRSRPTRPRSCRVRGPSPRCFIVGGARQRNWSLPIICL